MRHFYAVSILNRLYSSLMPQSTMTAPQARPTHVRTRSFSLPQLKAARGQVPYYVLINLANIRNALPRAF